MKNMNFKRAALVGLALIGAASSYAQGKSTLYGVTFFDNQLIKINPVTGAGSLVAALNDTVSAYGLATLGNQLYTFDPNIDQVRQINKKTGAVSSGISIGLSSSLDLAGEGDLAFSANGTGFLATAFSDPDFISANDLFRFNLSTGTSERIGSTSVALDGMAFIGDTLYAIGQEAEARLYTVNQDTAELTSVGLLSIDNGDGLVANDNLFGALTSDGMGGLFTSINDRLYSVDPFSGQAVQLDSTVLDFGFSSVSGLTYATPDGSPLAVAGMALVLMTVVARRKTVKVVS